MIHPNSQPALHEQAITKIAQLIKENPDTSGGVQLRKFLWSLYNMHHVVSLWSFASRLSSELADPVSEILRAALTGELTEDDIKRGLIISGEMSRWDRTRPSGDVVTLLQEAQQSLFGALARTPPCYEHTEIHRLNARLAELGHQISANTNQEA